MQTIGERRIKERNCSEREEEIEKRRQKYSARSSIRFDIDYH